MNDEDRKLAELRHKAVMTALTVLASTIVAAIAGFSVFILAVLNGSNTVFGLSVVIIAVSVVQFFTLVRLIGKTPSVDTDEVKQ